MSFAVDVNVLVYASSSEDRRGPLARSFLARCAGDSEPFCLAWGTLMSYLRLVTNGVIRRPAMSSDEAHQNLETLMRLPQVRLLVEPEGFWPIYREVARSVAARANLIPDVHLAALLKAHGVKTLYTNDADFRRFTFLDVRNPFP